MISIDIAIDFPLLPELISFQKDQRALKTYSRSKTDKTEYLGKNRNKPGSVKKYDKAKESKLSAPLLMDHSDKIKYYHMLGKKMQKKIEPLILSDEVEYAYDINLISQVAYKMISILTFDYSNLEDGIFYVKPNRKFYA